MSKKIKIHLADDHQLLVDGLTNLITSNPNYVITGSSTDGTNLIQKVMNEKANILILDINMPNVGGLAVLEEFSTKKPPFDIIVFSCYDDLKLIRESIRFGAKGYLTKQCKSDNILEAINAVSNGEEYFCETVSAKILSAFRNKTDNHIVSKDYFVHNNISERELQIIKLISLEFSTDEISNALFISSNTVSSHRKKLIRKLNVKSSIGLVTYAIKHDLINH